MAKIRTLIVDDNSAFLRSASQMLDSYSELQVVGEASSAAGAVAQVDLLNPDLVLIDMIMPDLNGLDATRLIKAKPGAPKVIICTLYDDIRYEEAATEAGADGFIPKSALSRGLLALVQEVFSRREE